MAQDFETIGSTTADTVARVPDGETLRERVIYVSTQLVASANSSDK